MSSNLPRPVAAAMRRPRAWLDGVAMAASVLCLIHCLVLPTVLIAVPMLAAVLTIPEGFHPLAFAFAMPTSLLALRSGYRRHRRGALVVVAFAGLTLLGLGAFAVADEAAERAVSALGALLLAVAHAWNWRAMSHGRRHDPFCPAADDG